MRASRLPLASWRTRSRGWAARLAGTATASRTAANLFLQIISAPMFAGDFVDGCRMWRLKGELRRVCGISARNAHEKKRDAEHETRDDPRRRKSDAAEFARFSRCENQLTAAVMPTETMII